MILDWFRIGFGLVLVIIKHSIIFNINAIYLYRYMAFILEIYDYDMDDK